MSIEATDVLMIGAGAGGVPAAIRARQLGAEVVLVEKDRVGGACMNRGCIPTKTLLETAKMYRATLQAENFGLRIPSVEIDWSALMDKKAQTMEYLRLGTESVLKANGVKIVRGRAAFTGPNTVKIGEQTISAKAIILGVGTEYAAPGIDGIGSPGVITPDDLLSMTDIPARTAILGGGPVELELAQYLTFLGSKVTLLVSEKRILDEPEYRELSGRLSKELKNQGMEVLTTVNVERIIPEEQGLKLEVTSKNDQLAITVDRVLHANRVPALGEMNLDAAGLKTTENALAVNDRLRTAVDHIYAIGDCSGGPFFSHRAAGMGVAAAQNASGMDTIYDEKVLVRCVTAFPEAAAVGLTEKQARKAGYDVAVGMIPYAVNAMGMIRLDTRGMVKIVAENKYRQVLGVHIIGPGASEMIGEGALAVETEACLDDLILGLRYHPTFSESQTDASRESLGRGIYVLR